MLKRRLFLQIYFTIIASLVIVVVLSGLLWRLIGRDHFNREVFDVTGKLAYLSLPAADAPDSLQREAVERLGQELDIDISLFDRHRRLIAANGKASPPPSRSLAYVSIRAFPGAIDPPGRGPRDDGLNSRNLDGIWEISARGSIIWEISIERKGFAP